MCLSCIAVLVLGALVGGVLLVEKSLALTLDFFLFWQFTFRIVGLGHTLGQIQRSRLVAHFGGGHSLMVFGSSLYVFFFFFFWGHNVKIFFTHIFIEVINIRWCYCKVLKVAGWRSLGHRDTGLVEEVAVTSQGGGVTCFGPGWQVTATPHPQPASCRHSGSGRRCRAVVPCFWHARHHHTLPYSPFPHGSLLPSTLPSNDA